jgi:hypothetical protein
VLHPLHFLEVWNSQRLIKSDTYGPFLTIGWPDTQRSKMVFSAIASFLTCAGKLTNRVDPHVPARTFPGRYHGTVLTLWIEVHMF